MCLQAGPGAELLAAAAMCPWLGVRGHRPMDGWMDRCVRLEHLPFLGSHLCLSLPFIPPLVLAMPLPFFRRQTCFPLSRGSAGHLPWDIGVFLGRGACTARSPGLLLC